MYGFELTLDTWHPAPESAPLRRFHASFKLQLLITGRLQFAIGVHRNVAADRLIV
jgi:hypothetical protein